jgi:integrase
LSRQLADLSVLAGLPRLTAHGLRHTSATLVFASGIPPNVAAERLGHANATLLTNLYSHVTPTMQRDAADRLGAALFGDGDATDVAPTKVTVRPRRAGR